MILTCPQCATRYLLPAHTLAPEGRRVKCSNCEEIWFQLPDTDELAESGSKSFEDIPEGVRPLPDGSNLPTVSEEETSAAGGRSRVMGYAAAAAIFAVIFAGLVLFEKRVSAQLEFTQPFYAMLGYEFPVPGKNLGFGSLEAAASPDSAGEKISIQGKISNLSAAEEQVPMIEAQMQGEGGKVLERWIIRPPAPTVPAQGELAFSTDYLIATPGSAQNIHLQFIAVQD